MSTSSVDQFARVRESAMRMREESHMQGVISPAHKAVISAAIFASQRCEPCYKAYLLLAHELGAELDYTLEVFNLVINATGCMGDVWGARAIEFFRALQDGKIQSQDVLDEVCDVLNPERMLKLIESMRE